MDRITRRTDRTLLILDLDETLIHATETMLDRPPDFEVFGYHVYRRPYLELFLESVRNDFDLAVWSSASDGYVQAVVDHIFEEPASLQFIWGRSRATLRRVSQDESGHMIDPWDHTHYLKPLAKVRRMGWRLERVLIVDDTLEKCVRNYGNAVHPRPYEGDASDAELPLLAAYLRTLKSELNVRSIEKRRWRDVVRRVGGIEGVV
jgi:RNA polymerase II subunit A small phosphatase-like protein